MRTGHVSVGHPVDVASGTVFTASNDFRLPGTVRLLWRRHYATSSPANTWLGRGWSVPYFMRLERSAEGYVLTGETGGAVLFPAPTGPLREGAVLTNLGANLELWRERERFTVVHWHDGGSPIIRFCFAARADERMPLSWCEN